MYTFVFLTPSLYSCLPSRQTFACLPLKPGRGFLHGMGMASPGGVLPGGNISLCLPKKQAFPHLHAWGYLTHCRVGWAASSRQGDYLGDPSPMAVPGGQNCTT